MIAIWNGIGPGTSPPAPSAYTNHTLLPEALEKWDLNMFRSLLPRHLELIYEINRRFLQQVRLRYPGNEAILSRLSIIDEEGNKGLSGWPTSPPLVPTM
jgi:glucan phosphorylase